MSGYLTVKDNVCDKTVIERSEFICRIKHVETEQEAKDFILEVKKLESLATHNCYAYIADDKGLVQKFSDDGEPSGTAGMPMLSVLKNKNLFKIVAVVTRYFGGIKLGAGGLVRAYSGAVNDCLKKAQILDMQPAELVCIIIDYENYSNLLRFLEGKEIKVISTNFENQVKVNLAVKLDSQGNADWFYLALNNYFNGKVTAKGVGKDFFAF